MIGATLEVGDARASDVIQPFQLEVPNLRGRMIRLGNMLDQILNAHAYPAPVAHLLAETITAAILLASLLKYEGIFTLQAKGSGPVHFLVTDITSKGEVRAYAQFDQEGLTKEETTPSFHRLLGDGYLAFTVDQGDDTERYQGIVSLEGETIADMLRHYFHQSEQLHTGLVLSAVQDEAKHWHGGAIILQKMPEEERSHATDSAIEDGWRRGMVLLGTCTDEELLDEGLSPTDLIYRLFHEERIRVFAPAAVRSGCRCSEKRVREVIAALPSDELESLKVDGELVVTCEFCSRSYRL